MQILYVDDDSDDRELFVGALKQLDPQISVCTFATGNEILAFLNSNEQVPQFVFIDINMPMMNGHECADRVRQIERLDKTKIVMFSTSFSTTDIKKFNEKNYKFLVKPSDYDGLLLSIRTYLE